MCERGQRRRKVLRDRRNQHHDRRHLACHRNEAIGLDCNRVDLDDRSDRRWQLSRLGRRVWDRCGRQPRCMCHRHVAGKRRGRCRWQLRRPRWRWRVWRQRGSWRLAWPHSYRCYRTTRRLPRTGWRRLESRWKRWRCRVPHSGRADRCARRGQRVGRRCSRQLRWLLRWIWRRRRWNDRLRSADDHLQQFAPREWRRWRRRKFGSRDRSRRRGSAHDRRRARWRRRQRWVWRQWFDVIERGTWDGWRAGESQWCWWRRWRWRRWCRADQGAGDRKPRNDGVPAPDAIARRAPREVELSGRPCRCCGVQPTAGPERPADRPNCRVIPRGSGWQAAC